MVVGARLSVKRKAVKKKKCRVCKELFTPFTSTQIACSMGCSITWARAQTVKRDKDAAKAIRKRHRADKERVKPKAKWMKEAQAAFNAYIRQRDEMLPCVSCPSTDAGQWHAGHYRTTAAAPELRFDEMNCHKQCAQCNNYKSGNVSEYRLNLIERIGQDALDQLEGPHEAMRYRIEDLKSVKSYYLGKRRGLKSNALTHQNNISAR